MNLTLYVNYQRIDFVEYFSIMVTKGDLWEENVRYVAEVHRAVQISAILIMSPREGLR